jgi:hypothetical protein
LFEVALSTEEAEEINGWHGDNVPLRRDVVRLAAFPLSFQS